MSVIKGVGFKRQFTSPILEARPQQYVGVRPALDFAKTVVFITYNPELCTAILTLSLFKTPPVLEARAQQHVGVGPALGARVVHVRTCLRAEHHRAHHLRLIPLP